MGIATYYRNCQGRRFYSGNDFVNLIRMDAETGKRVRTGQFGVGLGA